MAYRCAFKSSVRLRSRPIRLLPQPRASVDAFSFNREILINVRSASSQSAHNDAVKKGTNDIIPTGTEVDSQSLPIEVVKKLQRETDDIMQIGNGPYIQGMETQLLNVLEQWHELNTSMVYCLPQKKYRSLGNRRLESFSVRISSYDHSIKTLKLQCVDAIDVLLQFYCSHHLPSMTKVNTRPFSIAIQAWAASRDPRSSLKVAGILDQWGQLYGGQLDYAPTLDEFNLLLEIYAHEAAKDYSTFQNKNQSGEALPAEKAWDIFEFLIGADFQPDTVTYSHLVHALTHHAFVLKYAKKHFEFEMGSDVAAIRAFFLWKKMKGIQNTEKTINRADMVWRAHIDVLSLSATAMLKRNEHDHHRSIGEETDEMLSEIMESFNKPEKPMPNTEYVQNAFLTVMVAWVRDQESLLSGDHPSTEKEHLVSSATRAALSVDGLLAQLKNNLEINPTVEHYYQVIKAYTICMNEKVLLADTDGKVNEDLSPVSTISDLLEEMERLHFSLNAKREETRMGSNHSTPRNMLPGDAYNRLLNLLYRDIDRKKSNDFILKKGMEAESIFYRMLRFYATDQLWVANENTLTEALNSVLNIYSLCEGEGKAVEHSSALLQNFMEVKKDKGRNVKKLDIGSFTAYLRTLSRNKAGETGKRVHRVLNTMKKMNVNHNLLSYSLAITALAREKGNHLKALNLLTQAMEEYKSMDSDNKSKHDFNAAIIFTAVVKSLLNVNNDQSSKALALFQTLKDEYEMSKDPSLKPDIVLYSTIITILSRKGGPSDISRALELLDELESKYANGEIDMRPNKYCLTPIVVALSKGHHSDAFGKAEEVINRMEMLFEESGDVSTRPDHVSYSLLLLILSRSKDHVDFSRAQGLLETMHEKTLNIDGFEPPNSFTYSVFLNILANSGEADKGEKAERLLEDMEEKASLGYLHSKPDEKAFSSVIKCLARSNSPNKAKRSWALLNQMMEQYKGGDLKVKPTPRTLCVVLNACAHTSQKEEHLDALRVALEVQSLLFNELELFGRPGSQIFLNLMKAFGALVSGDQTRKEDFVNAVFRRYCKEGLVDETILEFLKRNCPSLYRNLPGGQGSEINLEALPVEWSRAIQK